MRNYKAPWRARIRCSDHISKLPSTIKTNGTKPILHQLPTHNRKQMRKLKLDELNRVTPEEFKEQKKFPVSVVLDNIKSGMNVGIFFTNGDSYAIEKIYLNGYTPRPHHKEIFKTAIVALQSVACEHHQEGVPLIRSLNSLGWYCVGIEQTTASVFLQNVTKP